LKKHKVFEKKNIGGLFQKLNEILDRRTKTILLIMLFFTVVFSVVETVGISAIMPFISMASDPDIIETGYYKIVYDLFGFENKIDFIFYCGAALVIFYPIRGAYSVVYTYFLHKLAFRNFAYFANKLFQKYLYMQYKDIVKHNSSAIIKTISSETLNLSFLIQNFLLFCSECFTVLFFYVLLLYVKLKMTLALTAIMGISVFIIVKTINKIGDAQGKKRNESQESFFKLMNASFGNFKMLKLKGNEKEVLSNFSCDSGSFAKSYTILYAVSYAPRYLLESIGFSVLLAAILYVLLKYDNPSLVIPIISLYALALYRMLPGISRMLGNYNQIVFFKKSLDTIHKNLTYDTIREGEENISFANSITLQNVHFSYNEKAQVIKNISLAIRKGEKVAFVGESGRGKSTLVDLIIGMHYPQSGEILIDNIPLTHQNIRSWRSKIGYIPQDVYLFDGTVGENVAFGSDFDQKKIIEVLKVANIWDFLEKKDGLDTIVGERGLQLSGGQKQRIAIARALYNEPEVLVLDEATSALDNETEAKIMDEIYNISKDKTLIVIAHRLSTVEKCDRKFQI
jgi:ATP-binding cassette subfamily B protein/ATP-binding cassette subfamily C protein